MNAGKEPGKELASRFGVNGYPTLVVTDARGEEIDRLVGYRPPRTIIPELEAMTAGKGYAALKAHVAANAKDYEAALQLAAKHEDRGKDEEARALYLKVSSAEDAPAGLRRQADSRLAVGAFFQSRGKDASGLEAFFVKHPDAPEGFLPAQILLRHYDRQGEEEKTSRLGAYLLKHAKDPVHAEGLNAVAWDLLQAGKRLKLALELAVKAVEIAPRDAAILDTLAVAYAKNGEPRKALETQRLAVKLAPEELRSELEGRLKEFEDAAKQAETKEGSADGKDEGNDGER